MLRQRGWFFKAHQTGNKKITAELSNSKEGQYLCGGRKNIVPHKQLKKETYEPRIQEKQH